MTIEIPSTDLEGADAASKEFSIAFLEYLNAAEWGEIDPAFFGKPDQFRLNDHITLRLITPKNDSLPQALNQHMYQRFQFHQCGQREERPTTPLYNRPGWSIGTTFFTYAKGEELSRMIPLLHAETDRLRARNDRTLETEKFNAFVGLVEDLNVGDATFNQLNGRLQVQFKGIGAGTRGHALFEKLKGCNVDVEEFQNHSLHHMAEAFTLLIDAKHPEIDLQILAMNQLLYKDAELAGLAFKEALMKLPPEQAAKIFTQVNHDIETSPPRTARPGPTTTGAIEISAAAQGRELT